MILPYGVLEEAVNLAKLQQYIVDHSSEVNMNTDRPNELAKSIRKSLGGGAVEFEDKDLKPYGVSENELDDACKALIEIAKSNKKEEMRKTFREFTNEYGAFSRISDKLIRQVIQDFALELKESDLDRLIAKGNNLKYSDLNYLNNNLIDLFNIQPAEIERSFKKMKPEIIEVLQQMRDNSSKSGNSK